MRWRVHEKFLSDGDLRQPTAMALPDERKTRILEDECQRRAVDQ